MQIDAARKFYLQFRPEVQSQIIDWTCHNIPVKNQEEKINFFLKLLKNVYHFIASKAMQSIGIRNTAAFDNPKK